MPADDDADEPARRARRGRCRAGSRRAARARRRRRSVGTAGRRPRVAELRHRRAPPSRDAISSRDIYAVPARRCQSPAGSATTKRDEAYPFGSRKIRPPIAVISRRAANRPIPEPRLRPRPSIRTNGSKTLSQSSMRDARAVVGDVDLDLVADPPDADAHAVGRRGVLRLVLEQLLEDLAEARLVADRDHAARPGGPSGSGAAGAGAAASRRSRRPPRPRRTAPATARSGPRRGPTRGSNPRAGRAAPSWSVGGRRATRPASAASRRRRPAAASASRST